MQHLATLAIATFAEQTNKVRYRAASSCSLLTAEMLTHLHISSDYQSKERRERLGCKHAQRSGRHHSTASLYSTSLTAAMLAVRQSHS